MATPSLAMIPCGTKASKVYSVLPTDGTGDFTFSRASSATRVNSEGLIEEVLTNVPRLNYPMIDGVVSGCPSLLLEPQRTNNFQQSNQFDTTWQISAAGVSVTPNQVGVGNSQDAWKLTEGTFNGEHFIRQTPNIGGVVSVSVYAKAGTNDFLYIRGVNSGLNRRTWFNLSTGTVGTNQGISAEMISMGDGWYRCVMVLDHQTAFEYYIAVSNADGVSSYQGSNNYIYIQNAQLEQGSYATSYIPTSGSAVTRVAETCSQTPPSGIIGQTEGVLFIDFTPNTDTISTKWLSFLGSGQYYIGIYVVSTSNTIRLEVADRTNQAIFNSSFSIVKGQQYKCAIAYANNDFTAYINGVQLGTVTSGSVPTTSTIRNYYNLSNIESTNTRDLRLYNTRLSNAELQALTKI